MYERKCVDSCPPGFVLTTDQLGCEAAYPPIAMLIVLLNNSLSVLFDKQMKATLTSEDISVDVASQNENFSVEWASPLFTDNQTLLVPLYFEKDYLPSGTPVLLTFISPEKVIDVQNITIDVQLLRGTLNAMGNPPSNTSNLLQTSSTQQTAAAAGGGVAANMISSIVSGNPSNLLATFSSFQLIAYLSLSPLALSDDFTGALAA